MDRRRFLVGVGSAAVGGSALVGSGAFTRVESQRQVTVDIAHDSEAYLGLAPCGDKDDKPNSSFADFDDDGHLTIDLWADNPTDAGGQGINSDSHTWFHNVFKIRNQGKQNIWVWIEAEPAFETDTGEDAVQFYWDSRPDVRIDGEENAFDLGTPGDTGICVGIQTVTKGLKEGDRLLEDDEIVIHAAPDDPDPESTDW